MRFTITRGPTRVVLSHRGIEDCKSKVSVSSRKSRRGEVDSRLQRLASKITCGYGARDEAVMLRQRCVACFAAVGRAGVYIRCRDGQPVAGPYVAGPYEVVDPQMSRAWCGAPRCSPPLISVRARRRCGKRVEFVQIMNRKREGRARILGSSQRGRAKPLSFLRRQFCAQEKGCRHGPH